MTLSDIRSRTRELEHELLAQALGQGGWSQVATARLLECPRTTLRRLLERHPRLMDRYRELRPGPPGRPRRREA